MEDCRKLLAQADSVMEPGVADTIEHFFKTGGEPGEAIQLMAGSYRGLSQMSNLLVSWLKLAGLPDDAIKKKVAQRFHAVVLLKFDPRRADELFSKLPVEFVSLIGRTRLASGNDR